MVAQYGLTPVQTKAFDFIVEYFAINGFSPSYSEMMTALRLASKSSVHRLVTALERRGRIRRIPAADRSIVPVLGEETRDHIRINAEMFVALQECAEDLAAEVNARYPLRENGDRYPSEQRRYEQDMAPVWNARAVLSRAKAGIC